MSKIALFGAVAAIVFCMVTTSKADTQAEYVPPLPVNAQAQEVAEYVPPLPVGIISTETNV